ncbi:sigma factor [Croceicoccus naphthovorans]|uniref:sigma factor n=1 Tax=Croceicoccus naphthovorans TaxID=1348774 RepID=UPI00069E592F|nr:sigma factor [Croceicoccus naphthovorans]MBB3989958.1 RNA polymerase sigma-32 factor [Croceicoccus naphthovorans]
MSATTDALEREIAAIRALRIKVSDARSRREEDRIFARIMRLIAPRVRHFTRAYGLVDMAEDAEQACAIGVHRAIDAYDPDRARFTTFVNWQLRCELQALRHRVRLDSRDSAKRIGARTVSLDALAASDGTVFDVEDDAATDRVEASAADRIAEESFEAMLDAYEAKMRDRAQRALAKVRLRQRETMPGTLHPDDLTAIERDLASERAIVTRYVFADSDKAKFDPDHPLDNEKQRQISRRVLRSLRAQAGPMMLN